MKEPRSRHCAYCWMDKRAIRWFRDNFETNDFRNLRTIYIALCEIDSDIKEDLEIEKIIDVVTSYTALQKRITQPYLEAMEKAGLIEYTKRPGENYVYLFDWDYIIRTGLEEKGKTIKNYLSNQDN